MARGRSLTQGKTEEDISFVCCDKMGKKFIIYISLLLGHLPYSIYKNNNINNKMLCESNIIVRNQIMFNYSINYFVIVFFKLGEEFGDFYRVQGV